MAGALTPFKTPRRSGSPHYPMGSPCRFRPDTLLRTLFLALIAAAVFSCHIIRNPSPSEDSSESDPLKKQINGGSFGAPDTVPLFVHHDQTSVKHYLFPGEVSPAPPPGVNNLTAASVLLHLFIKCVVAADADVADDVSASCAGFGFAEGTDSNVSRLFAHLYGPYEMGFWEPRIEVRVRLKSGVTSSYRLNVSIAKSEYEPYSARLRPFHFWGELPLRLRDQLPELHVDDWPRCHVFQNLDAPEVAPPVAHPPPTSFLMSAFYYEPPRGSYALAAQLLVHHVRHHLALGFAGDVMYVLRHYPAKLLQNEELKTYVERGQLRLIVWDAFPKYELEPGSPFDQFDQQIQYSHGVLEHWGRGARLLLGDIDEFLVSDKPGNVTDVLTCTGWPEQARLTRYDVMCSGEVCPGDGENEIKVWESPEKDPLRHYTLINRQEWSIRQPKVLVSPEGVRHTFVHDALVVPGGRDVPVPRECGYMVHPRSMYVKRCNKTDFVKETDWQWVLKQGGESV